MLSKEEVKVEDKQLHDYEMVLIISPEIGNEDIDAVIDKISQFITGKGGSVSGMERWGKRRLAYPIEHFMEGDYVLSRFKLKPKAVKELETNLQISEEVLRHLLIKVGS